jgi:hypothetical protein
MIVRAMTSLDGTAGHYHVERCSRDRADVKTAILICYNLAMRGSGRLMSNRDASAFLNTRSEYGVPMKGDPP